MCSCNYSVFRAYSRLSKIPNKPRGVKNPAKYQTNVHSEGILSARATGTIPKRHRRAKLLKTNAGTLELVGHDRAKIVAAAARLLSDGDAYKKMSTAHNPYGDGHASERIAAWLLARLRGADYPKPFEVDLTA